MAVIATRAASSAAATTKSMPISKRWYAATKSNPVAASTTGYRTLIVPAQDDGRLERAAGALEKELAESLPGFPPFRLFA